MTKRAITTQILNDLGEEGNHELYERLKDKVITLRAKLLRQSIRRNGVDELLKQTYTIKLEKKIDDNDCIYFESICKIFTPIRQSTKTVPFEYVGTKFNIPYTFLRGYEIHTIPNIIINSHNKYYTLVNQKLRTYNSTAKYLMIRDVFEGLDDLDIDCTGVCSDDDMVLPMPADLVTDIISIIVREFKQTQSSTIEEVED